MCFFLLLTVIKFPFQMFEFTECGWLQKKILQKKNFFNDKSKRFCIHNKNYISKNKAILNKRSVIFLRTCSEYKIIVLPKVVLFTLSLLLQIFFCKKIKQLNYILRSFVCQKLFQYDWQKCTHNILVNYFGIEVLLQKRILDMAIYKDFSSIQKI